MIGWLVILFIVLPIYFIVWSCINKQLPCIKCDKKDTESWATLGLIFLCVDIVGGLVIAPLVFCIIKYGENIRLYLLSFLEHKRRIEILPDIEN